MLDILQQLEIDTEKALNRAGLVQKDVVIQGKRGTYTAKRWIKTGQDVSNKGTKVKAEGERSQPKTIDMKQGAKVALAKLLQTKGRKGVMELAKKNKVTWEQSSNPGVDWFRASVAISRSIKSNPSIWGIKPNQDKPANKEENKHFKEEKTPNATKEVKEPQTKPTENPTPSKPKSDKETLEDLTNQVNEVKQRIKVERIHNTISSSISSISATLGVFNGIKSGMLAKGIYDFAKARGMKPAYMGIVRDGKLQDICVNVEGTIYGSTGKLNIIDTEYNYGANDTMIVSGIEEDNQSQYIGNDKYGKIPYFSETFSNNSGDIYRELKESYELNKLLE